MVGLDRRLPPCDTVGSINFDKYDQPVDETAAADDILSLKAYAILRSLERSLL